MHEEIAEGLKTVQTSAASQAQESVVASLSSAEATVNETATRQTQYMRGVWISCITLYVVLLSLQSYKSARQRRTLDGELECVLNENQGLMQVWELLSSHSTGKTTTSTTTDTTTDSETMATSDLEIDTTATPTVLHQSLAERLAEAELGMRLPQQTAIESSSQQETTTTTIAATSHEEKEELQSLFATILQQEFQDRFQQQAKDDEQRQKQKQTMKN